MKKLIVILLLMFLTNSVYAETNILKDPRGRGFQGIYLQNNNSGSLTLTMPTGDMSDVALYLPTTAGYIYPSSSSTSFAVSATTMPSGISKLIDSTVTVTPATNDTVFAGYGNLNFQGSASSGTGHGAGIIGLFTDTSASTFIGYGVEGRTNATGAASLYVGVLGLGTWTGAGSYAGILNGVEARCEMTTDGTTPNTSAGTCVAVYAPAVIGGATKYSFYGSDPMQVNSTITATGTISGGQIFSTPATTQTIAAGNTITADSCGGIKKISSAGGVTTDTTNTFTAPAAGNLDCCMRVINVGANNITLDNNANFASAGAADVVLGAADSATVCSTGSGGKWYQVAASNN